jgi:tRNA pseudouridine synthase 10
LVDGQGALLLKEYQLCKSCLARQAGVSRKKTVEKCYICRGLFERLDEIAKKALASAKQYQFSTFLVGATLPTGLYEREDALRARLKIRGRESVKNQLTRELGIRLSKMTKKKVDYARPDITINVTIDRDGGVEAAVRSRPLALLCRYVKKGRGLPQKSEKCAMCLGKGCNLCDGTGLASMESVEGIMAKHLIAITKGQSPRFSWIGSEDQSSLVLGRGRPFFAKVSDPKIRKPRKTAFKENGIEGKVVRVLDDEPDTQARFTVKTRIEGRCERPLDTSDVKKLKALAGAQVKFESKNRTAAKQIRSVRAKVHGNSFTLTLIADGGLPIKQFVGGEQYCEPSVSSLLQAKCECTTFDVLSVDFQNSIRS